MPTYLLPELSVVKGPLGYFILRVENHDTLPMPVVREQDLDLEEE